MKSFWYQILEPQKMLPNVKSVLSKTNSLDSTSSSNTNSKFNDNASDDHRSDIVKCGYLRKYKTMKKKFFVLRAGSESGPARLEYYDNEKRMKSSPKRSIVLQACFNINKKLDSKHKLAIALYTKDDCFSIVAESETELEEWLTWLLALQQGHVTREGNITTIDKEAKPKPHFEFMWQICVKSKGLASKSPELLGPRRLCLTSTTLSLVKLNEERESLDFPLMGIRRCGHSDLFFFMEVGRSSVTGAGEIWMQTEDVIIAQNMHEVILSAMKSCRSLEDLGPISRPRSASTSENGKPVSSRQGGITTSTAGSALGSSGSITGACGGSTSSVAGSCCTDRSERNSLTSVGANSFVQAIRDRCDSMPTRSRTVSEGHHDLGPRPFHFEMLRPHSTYGHMNAYSPPVVTNPLSPSSGGFSDSAGSSLSIDEFDSPSDFHHSRYLVHPSDGTLHTEPTITEENPDDYLSMAPIGLGENMTDSGVVVESRNSTNYSTASTISVASSIASTTSDYLQMEPNQKTPKAANSPPTFLNLASSNTSFQTAAANVVESKQIINSPSATPCCEVEQTPVTRKASSGYVEMKSPQSATAGYFMMSPGMIGAEDRDQVNHKPKDGYVQMNPATSAIPVATPFVSNNVSVGSPHPEAQYQGYICMDSNLSSSLPKSIPQSGNFSDYVEHMSSPRSNHSFQDTSLSCSPADVEFFHLEKVQSFIPKNSNDDDEDFIRPVRAYSIGSRPQVHKTHLANHLEQSRVRAYSFGSQNHSSRFRAGRSGDGSAINVSGVPHVPGIDWELGVPKSLDSSKVSKKSNSAPILPNSTNLNPSNYISAVSNAGASRVPFHTNKLPVSKSSDNRKEDLMEIYYDSSASSTSSHQRGVGSHENRRLSIGSLRQRTSNRSSSSALAAALNSHNHLAAKTATVKEAGATKSEQNPYLSNVTNVETGNVANQRSAASNNINNNVKQEVTYPQKPPPPSEYFEMSFSKGPNIASPQLPPPQPPIPSVAAIGLDNIEKVTPDIAAGEYVNLDLSKTTSWQLKDTRKRPTIEPNPTAVLDMNNKTQAHGYVNCTPDQKSVCMIPPSSNQTDSKKSGQFSEYFVMNFNKDKTRQNSDRLNPCVVTESNRPVVAAPSPLNVRKNEESDYCPVSSCDIAPSVFNKKNSMAACEMLGGKMNGRKSSNVASSIKALPTTEAAPSVWAPKTNVSSKDTEKNNSNNTASVFASAAAASKPSLADVSYENIQIGPPLSSSPSSNKGAPVVVVEKELNYASLDLPPSVDGEEKVPRTVKLGNGITSGYQQPESEEANGCTSTLSYAEIDFTKSEGLRNVSGSLREGRV